MPSTDNTTTAGVLATELFEDLTSDLDTTLPEVDFDSGDFDIPDASDNPLYGDIAPLTEGDLTSREVGGSGLFDGIMVAFSEHLKQEHSRCRITGAQYADAYIQLSTAALGSAVQYLLSRDQARWQALLVQKQAQAAEVAVVAARVSLEETKVRLAIAQLQAKLEQSNYALTKLKLASEDANWTLAKEQLVSARFTNTEMLPVQKLVLDADLDLKIAQKAQIEADTATQVVQTDKAIYELENMMPVQLEGIEADVAGKVYTNENILPAQWDGMKLQNDAQTYTIEFILPKQADGLGIDNSTKTYNLDEMLPVQKQTLEKEMELKTAQVVQVTYENTDILPVQKLNLEADHDLKEAQLAAADFDLTQLKPVQRLGLQADNTIKDAQADQLVYQNTTMLPAEKLKIDAEEALLRFQLTSLLPAQVAGHTADTEGKDYTNTFILPAQLESIKEQTEGHRAKTLSTRTDGAPVAGSTGKQMELYDQQITSYQRDAEQKFLKMLVDGWITQKSMDVDVHAPNSMVNTEIDSVMSVMKNNLSLGS